MSSGKSVLVTGGGRGIGAAVARALAARGHRVAVVARTQAEVDAVAAEIGGVGDTADFLERDSVDAMFARVQSVIGNIEILVNNAGISSSAPTAKETDDIWDRTFEINVTAAFRLSRAVLPAMLKARWGRIVNLASHAGLTGYAYTAAYCASKHAMVGLTRAIAAEVAAKGITVNAVCPGWVRTEMAQTAADRIAEATGRTAAQAEADLAAMSPQNRMMEPSEIAATVAYLCDDSAQGIHGQAVVVDGGQVMK